MNKHVTDLATEVIPFRLKDAPSLIERIFPSMKISAEAQKERKAGQGQTLPALGSYWKGRKPLILVKACVLGTLLPVTEDLEKDLHIFELLMGVDDQAFERRVKRPSDYPRVLSLPYEERAQFAYRPEEISTELPDHVWSLVNDHLGTNATSVRSLVEQLGVMRFGRRPSVADTFCGGGSIPFEAARLGCVVNASDLNPIACMLTWAALNLTVSDEQARRDDEKEQQEIAAQVEALITELGTEHDDQGNRAKAYMYCLETRCPETGWMVPILPSRIISRKLNAVVDLVPDSAQEKFNFEIRVGVSSEDMKRADVGTLKDGRLYNPIINGSDGVAISALRGDYTDAHGTRRNMLRKWEKTDIVPRPDDLFQERLYCIQWIEAGKKGAGKTFFAAPTEQDAIRESKVEAFVRENLADWQNHGFLPDMPIDEGQNTSQPIWERGWTYWHHLFTPRQLLILATVAKNASRPISALMMCQMLNFSSRLCRIDPTANQGGAVKFAGVFSNQSLNTLYNYGVRGGVFLPGYAISVEDLGLRGSDHSVRNVQVVDVAGENDIYITDPPYADAVNYHEITEYFIAWLRKNPPKPFDEWRWDSRRRLAIKGKGDEFRANMVQAYKVMADHMPDNGIQVVMFTHQDGKVWSDMTQIFWGAGLQVMADWYIATETTSELKKGGYVQGTHIIVLRKRPEALSGYSDEISQEVKEEVARQIEEMVGLNQTLRGHGRSENLFNDADLQMAGYAAALRVLTSYVKIDGKDMTVEAMRPRARNERTIVDEIIEYAVQVANEHLVPEGMGEQTWRRLSGMERFYLKMLDIESTGAKKVDNYQNFAKAFRVPDHGVLMASEKANDARLKTAADFGKRQMGDDEFGSSLTRAVLYALWEMGAGVDDDMVMEHLRGLVGNYLEKRTDLQTIARYIALKRYGTQKGEATNAEVLAGMIKNERLG
jgi:adenine-specific DNA methylase